MPSSIASSGRRLRESGWWTTLLLARRKHPGVSNRLGDLCSRYAIDNSRRTKHGALLDARLGEVYIDLIGARQSQLILAETPTSRAANLGDMPRRQRLEPLAPDDRADRVAAVPVATLGDKPIWNDFLGLPLSSAEASLP